MGRSDAGDGGEGRGYGSVELVLLLSLLGGGRERVSREWRCSCLVDGFWTCQDFYTAGGYLGIARKIKGIRPSSEISFSRMHPYLMYRLS